MSKIYAEYRVSSVWDMDLILEDLEITKEQVIETSVKWDLLYIDYTDAEGQAQTAEIAPNVFCASSDIDGQCFKYPQTVTEE
jgi:hypothetical protein